MKNRFSFIHRIVSQPSKKVLSREQFYDEILLRRPPSSSLLSSASALASASAASSSVLPKLIWFGEFHSEERIIAFQNELLENLMNHHASSLSSSEVPSVEPVVAAAPSTNTKVTTPPPPLPPPPPTTTIHIVMEHFSIEMQNILDQFQTDPHYGFEELQASYTKIGTEGHNLNPYKSLLLQCKNQNTTKNNSNTRKNVQLKLYGGFIPRTIASSWYKATTLEEKQDIIHDCYQKDYLPKPSTTDDHPRRMHDAVFVDNLEDKFILEGSQPHFRCIASMMSGEDLYDSSDVTVTEDEDNDVADETTMKQGNNQYFDDGIIGTPIGKLYQAQLLKDHVMAYHISKLIMDNTNDTTSATTAAAAAATTTTDTNTNTNTTTTTTATNNDDLFLIVAGLGHMKHYLGVPERLQSYLSKATIPTVASISAPVTTSSIMISSQMLYETYLEDRYEPLEQLEDNN